MKRTFVIPILFFFAFSFSVYFILPEYAEFKDLKAQVSEKEADLELKKSYFSNLKKISDDLEKEQEALEKIDSALPKEISLASLLNFFQIKASESGLIVETLGQVSIPSEKKKTGETETKGKIQESYFTITLVGSLPSFESFLQSVESSARLVEVENISLQESEEELLEFVLLTKVYSEQ